MRNLIQKFKSTPIGPKQIACIIVMIISIGLFVVIVSTTVKWKTDNPGVDPNQDRSSIESLSQQYAIGGLDDTWENSGSVSQLQF